jgi:hypothetical protein
VRIYVVIPPCIRLTVGPCVGHGCLHDCRATEFYERDIEYLVFVCLLSIQNFLELVPPLGLGFENTQCLVRSVFGIVKRDRGNVSGAQFQLTELCLISLGTTCESFGPYQSRERPLLMFCPRGDSAWPDRFWDFVTFPVSKTLFGNKCILHEFIYIDALLWTLVFTNSTGTDNTRREPDVGGLEGRNIVRAIAGDTNDLTKIAVGLKVTFLILRGRSSQDLKTGDELNVFIGVRSVEDRALQ